jgi:hypothetical protein
MFAFCSPCAGQQTRHGGLGYACEKKEACICVHRCGEMW